MKRVGFVALTFIAASFLAASGASSQNKSAHGAAKPPTVDALMILEIKANDAFSKGDAKFFEGLLSDKFVMRDGKQRKDKAAVVKTIAGVKCDVKSVNLDESWIAKIDTDTYVFSYRTNWDGTCIGPDGKSMKIPTPTRAATIWVRNGDPWQAAFHGAIPIIDPATQQVSPSAGSAGSAQLRRSDADTKSLAALETAVWEAWKAHDFKKLDDLAAENLSFIDIFGNSYGNRNTILRTWSSNVCKVKSVKVTDAVAFAFSPTVKLLTHTGTADGTCYGQKIGPVYGNSIYVKDGKDWKLAFTMNMPGM